MEATPNAEQQPRTGAPPEAEPQAAPDAGKRERKPPSEAQAKKAAAAKRLKRQMEKLLAAGDTEALEAAALALDGKGGAVGDAGAAAAQPASVEERKVAPVAPSPSPEEAAAMMPLATTVVAMIAGPLAGTAYDPMRPCPNPFGGEAIISAQQLVHALAPVLAKYVPAVVTTPEGQLALAVALWLGPPTVEVVKAKVMGGGADPAGAAGVGVAA